MQLLKKVVEEQRSGCLATLFQLHDSLGYQPGTCLLAFEKSILCSSHLEIEYQNPIREAAKNALAAQTTSTETFICNDKKYGILLDYIPEPVLLVIAGAGNDAMPLAQIAHALGWRVSVIDGRSTHVTQQRFSWADALYVVKAGETPPQATAYMLMSHNYSYDMAILRALGASECKYIGILGPKAKRERMLLELEKENSRAVASLRPNIFGPAGLDIGAETAEEIALSVVAEIKTVLSSANAGFLRDKMTAIHAKIPA
jgi:xanthine/CO dehydrogenase XdhC/CoxF family maturation factor